MEPISAKIEKNPVEVLHYASSWAPKGKQATADWIKVAARRSTKDVGEALLGFRNLASHLIDESLISQEKATNLTSKLLASDRKVMHRNYGLILGGILSLTAILGVLVLSRLAQTRSSEK